MAEAQAATEPEPAVQKAPKLGFIVSLVGGIIIIIYGILMVALAAPWAAESVAEKVSTQEGAAMIANFTDSANFTDNLKGYHDFVYTYLIYGGTLGSIFGALVIIGAVLLKKGKRVAGGRVVLIFSALSILGGAGSLIGMILGIVGGILGLKGR